MSRLDELDLTQKVSREIYNVELKKLQKKILKKAVDIYSKRKPGPIIVFEGMDAAGKGGAIRRLTAPLDPELYRVLTSSAPTPEEISRHYLWRFHSRLPGPGVLTIFDRSWYGRVLVERVEGFASPAEWGQAYDEINEMEKSWLNVGIPVIKFWLQIDLDEQYRRFKDRENSPLKSWKLTEEDWRNREKWPEYKAAINDMLEKTSPPRAPWRLIEATDKQFARLKVLRHILDAL